MHGEVAPGAPDHPFDGVEGMARVDLEAQALRYGDVAGTGRQGRGVETVELRRDARRRRTEQRQLVRREPGFVPVLPADALPFRFPDNRNGPAFPIRSMTVKTDEDPIEPVAGPKREESRSEILGRMPEPRWRRARLPEHVADAHLAHDGNTVGASPRHRRGHAFLRCHDSSFARQDSPPRRRGQGRRFTFDRPDATMIPQMMDCPL